MGIGTYIIGAVLTSCACFVINKLNEWEREKQREIRRGYQEFRRNVEIMAQDYKEKARNELRKEYKNAEITQEEEMRRAYELNKKEVIEYYNKLKKEIETRIDEKTKFLIEIKKQLKDLETIRKETTTYVRNRSYNLLEIELDEAQNYLEGYLKYLNEYEKRLEKEYQYNLNIIGEGKFYKFEIEPFEFILPNYYPYCKKLIVVDIKDIGEDGSFKKLVEGLFHPKSFKIVDIENLEIFKGKDITVPMVIEELDAKSGKWEWKVNIGKGLLVKNLMEQPEIGIEAIVDRVEEKYIILDYYGVKLKLNKGNLNNPRVTPVRGAILTVYPLEIKREIRNNIMPLVTEDKRESMILEYISDIPLLLRKEDEKKIKEYLLEKSKREDFSKMTCMKWRVGKKEGNEDILILQLEESLAILAIKIVTESGSSYLRFLDFTDEKLTVNDTYLSINGTFNIRVEKEEETLTEFEQESIETFLILIELEFAKQKKIREAVSGRIYYNKWLDITDKLVNHMFKDKEKFLCKFGDFQIKREEKNYKRIRIWTAEIQNFEKIKKNLEKLKEDKNIEFIMENEFGQYYEVRFFTELEDNRAEIIEKLNDNFVESLRKENKLKEIYVKRFPYAEIQQKKALIDFKNSVMENPNIKLSLLSGKNIDIISMEKRIKIEKFFNKDIECNIYQRKIVEEVMSSKDIFYIQGPPGTGKTTVIKEIILQQLYLNPNSNILVTSQTNVAVDNVLKGLEEYRDNIDKNEFLRCGNDDKIAEEVKEYSYDKIIEKYRKEFNEIVPFNEKEEKIKELWAEYITEVNKLNNELGELLLRSKRIIGATCVGIANKKIGLDNMTFDLVIVDEASKALPAEILIPLNKAKKCVIIGDHKQLPPTLNKVLTNGDEIELEDREYCKDELFDKSMFERLFEEAPDYAKGMLKTQYRMPTSVGDMVSKFFYDEELENGENCKSKTSLFFEKNLNWIDTSNIENNIENDTMSPFNLVEVSIIKDLIKAIRDKGIDNRIAIITPYKGQKREIIRCLEKEKLKNGVAVDTVDSFQGDEADIVIFSVTRTKKRTEFFSKDARLNVAFSRVKRELIIVGNINYFIKRYGKESKLSKIANFVKENGNVMTIG